MNHNHDSITIDVLLEGLDKAYLMLYLSVLLQMFGEERVMPSASIYAYN
jgi:hypothetical protein